MSATPTLPSSSSGSRHALRLVSTLVVLSLACGCRSAGPRSHDAAPALEPSASAAPPSASAGPPTERAFVRLESMTDDAFTGAPLTVARWGRGGSVRAIVARTDAEALDIVDVDSAGTVARVVLGTPPPDGRTLGIGHVVVLPDGSLAAAVRRANEVAIFKATQSTDTPLVRVASLTVPDDPVAVAVSRDGAFLYVACAAGNKVVAFRTDSLTPAWESHTRHEPRALVTTESGHVVVGHAADSSLLAISSDGETMQPLDLTRKSLPDGYHQLHNYNQYFGRHPPHYARQVFSLLRLAIGPERIVLPVVRVDAGRPSAKPPRYGAGWDRGGGHGDFSDRTPPPIMYSDIDVIAAPPLRSLTKINVFATAYARGRAFREGCLLPRGVALDRRRNWVATACAGNNEVQVHDAAKGASDAAGAVTGQRNWDGNNPAAALRRRIPVPAGPVGIVHVPELDAWILYTAFEPSIVIAPVMPNAALRTISLGPMAESEREIARGRARFHATGDRRISADGVACASCHPDGRSDGLTWSSPDGPRKTPSIAGSHAGPQGSPVAEDALIEREIRRLGGTGLEPSERRALVAYLRSIPPSRAH